MNKTHNHQHPNVTSLDVPRRRHRQLLAALKYLVSESVDQVQGVRGVEAERAMAANLVAPEGSYLQYHARIRRCRCLADSQAPSWH